MDSIVEDEVDEEGPTDGDFWRNRGSRECAQMLENEVLRNFWEFATTVRRTSSLAARQSQMIRGTFLTPWLAVQRIHGWGQRSVRLLCVYATSEEHREKLKYFFEKDRYDAESRRVFAQDGLDSETRVLVKLPVSSEMSSWIAHEREVLSQLDGLPGIPIPCAPIFFEDIGIEATTYEYCGWPCLHDQLCTGKLVPFESVYLLASSILKTLGHAHDRGWLHTDLQPKDILLPPAVTGHQPRSTGGDTQSEVKGIMVCGWTRALRASEGNQWSANASNLVDFLQQLPVAPCRALDDKHLNDPDEKEPRQLVPTSIYSAPEQFVGIFAGCACESMATDIYRAAAVVTMAIRAYGPLGSRGCPVRRSEAKAVTKLRLLGQELLMRRAEMLNPTDAHPTAEEVTEYVSNLQLVLEAEANYSDAGPSKLTSWFHQALDRHPERRFQTICEAMDCLDEKWSDYEAECLATERLLQTAAAEIPKREPLKIERLVIEPPPELTDMTIL